MLVALISLFNFEICVSIYKFQNLFSEIIGCGNCKKHFLSKCYWNVKVGNDLIVFAFQAAFFFVLVSTDLLFCLELVCRDPKLGEMLRQMLKRQRVGLGKNQNGGSFFTPASWPRSHHPRIRRKITRSK